MSLEKKAWHCSMFRACRAAARENGSLVTRELRTVLRSGIRFAVKLTVSLNPSLEEGTSLLVNLTGERPVPPAGRTPIDLCGAPTSTKSLFQKDGDYNILLLTTEEIRCIS